MKEPAQTVLNVKDKMRADDSVQIKYVNLQDLTQIKDHDIQVLVRAPDS